MRQATDSTIPTTTLPLQLSLPVFTSFPFLVASAYIQNWHQLKFLEVLFITIQLQNEAKPQDALAMRELLLHMQCPGELFK